MPRPSPIRAALTCLTLGWGAAIAPAQANDAPTTIDTVLDQHILPGFQALETQAKALATEALRDCSITSPPLVQAYHDTFDAWVGISHLRFGPAEVENRAFHRTILEPCKMPRLMAAIDDLHIAAARQLFAHWSNDWEQRTDHDHRAILSALKRGDTGTACDILRRHLRRVG